MTAKELVRLENVWVYYDSIPVLEAINLSVESNNFLGIIGPNGGGKTTLLKVILGLIKPTRGKVTVLGMPPERGRKHIGYISQFNLFDHDFPISVFEVVLMGRYNRAGLMQRYREEDRKAATEALETVEMLDYKDRQIGKLSGGEQQRVFIAIDTSMQSDFYELLDKLKENMAIVLVSHDVSAVSIYVSEIACLNHQLFYHGSKEVSAEELEKTYRCPVQLIAHGTVPHRVLRKH